MSNGLKMKVEKDGWSVLSNCGNCVYYDGDTPGDGTCRRRAPLGKVMTEAAFQITNMVYWWPGVESWEYCGEWSPSPLFEDQMKEKGKGE